MDDHVGDSVQELVRLLDEDEVDDAVEVMENERDTRIVEEAVSVRVADGLSESDAIALSDEDAVNDVLDDTVVRDVEIDRLNV